MSRLISTLIFAGALAAGLLAASAAGAQPTGTRIIGGRPVKPVTEAPEPPPADAVVSGVTITAPRVIERSRAIGGMAQEMTMSARVPYRDLDMQTSAGVAELNRRVDEAAKYVCRQLSLMYPSGEPDAYACAREAVSDAQPQVKLAQAAR